MNKQARGMCITLIPARPQGSAHDTGESRMKR
jgi:hypothetical protein